VLLRRVFRPLHQLSAVMRGIDPLRPGARAQVETADPEVAELTAAFNEMITRLETERRESARRALSAQEAERVRIARELHDEVGQRLTAVMLQLDHDRTAREAVRSALEDVREIGRRLRPEALDDLGLAAALRSLVTGFEQSASLRVERDIQAPGPLTREQELVVYRVAQEALTNAARHSGTPDIRVELRRSVQGTRLAVEDDGRGLDGASEGTGIRGMRERALMVGARLYVTSGPAGGTRVELALERPPA
jgi:two-component system, NarL family, sensor histidine kinase UhpB